METPAPVNLSALSAILAKSKQVMNVVENKNPINTNSKPDYSESNDSYPSEMYNDYDEREPIYENYQPSQATYTPSEITDYTDEQVMNSNLPPMVKEAMIKNKIPRLTSPPSRFTAEEISKITGAPLKQPKQEQPKQMIRETARNNSDLITLSRTELQEMINESINNFFKQTYDKTLTEQTIKKTINMLIKEGKLAVKKKTI
jgi:hypothetical protein